MHDVFVEMVKEGHKQYINAMGRIKGKNYKDEAEAKTVILSVQQREGERKGNGVTNVKNIEDSSEMNGADSLELFGIEFDLLGESTEKVSNKT